MAKSKLEVALIVYQSALTTLERSQPRIELTEALHLLRARDKVARLMLEDDSPSTLLAVHNLDAHLRQLAGVIAKSVNLADWRASLAPSAESWWWFLDTLPFNPAVDRSYWLWNTLAIIFLTISLSLLVDTSTRFLGDSPDTWATFAVVGQALLVMLAAGGTVNAFGRELFDRTLASIKVPTAWYQRVRLTFAILLLLVLLGFRSFLPQIAILYNNRGLASYDKGQYTSAKFDFQRSLKLSPDYIIPHYNLGLLYEDLHDYDSAKTEYRIAAASKFDAAYNNLARLYIREKNYQEAVPLLLTGLNIAGEPDIVYDLHKNLGWTRLQQMRFSEAKIELEFAIQLDESQAAAHCLLGQVLDGQGKSDEALLEWEFCLKYADPRRPDEDDWIDIARQRLRGTGP